ncbi:MAG: hypothetical protein A2148_08605 [Chloroflexi bacterium RBG_16_68_14]|nr:MAG: hypothetical protein A2148_08605 [Chloroflexi bacterium RBG_16_68_14]
MSNQQPRAGPMLRAFSGPALAIVLERAASAIEHIAQQVYEAKGTEWGGVTFGRLWNLAGHLIVVIEDATEGSCANASPVRCDILPQSWDYGEAQIRRQNRSPGLRIGTWHSHPHMAPLPSRTMDAPAFWSYQHVPHFVGIIVNPYARPQPERACWALGEMELFRVPSYVLKDAPWTRRVLALRR